MTDLHFVVPDAMDDPWHPSGGNGYDRRVSAGLRSLGWTVVEHRVAGPRPALGHGPWSGSGPESESSSLDREMATIPTGSVALLDGLIASGSPGVLVPAAARLRLVVLVHLPLGHSWSAHGLSEGLGHRPSNRSAGPTDEGQIEASGDSTDEGPNGATTGPSGDHREERVLAAAAAVIATSAWTRRRLLELYPLDPTRVHVVEPGVDPAALGLGTSAGSALLCVAAVTPDKGHDLLIAALATVADLPWQCTCAGALDLAPGWVERLRQASRRAGIEDRLHFVGPLSCTDLDRAYAAADVLVHASRGETYAMVVTEALARGLPVIATSVGGLAEALGHGGGGGRPGLLTPAGDPDLFGAALRSWLVDDRLRQRLRAQARARRRTLSDWSVTARGIAEVLDRVAC